MIEKPKSKPVLPADRADAASPNPKTGDAARRQKTETPDKATQGPADDDGIEELFNDMPV